MWPSSQFTADLVTFTEEILHGKLYFLCSQIQAFWFSARLIIWKIFRKSSETLICRKDADSCFCIISDFGCKTNYALAKIKKSSILIILKYHLWPHDLFQFCMYRKIHRYKQNEDNRDLNRVRPSNAFIIYLNRFLSFFGSLFK